MGAVLNSALGERYGAAVDRVAGGDRELAATLADPNALLQPEVRQQIPADSYAELAAALAAALSPVFWIVLALSASGIVVALLFPRGSAREMVHRED